MSSVLGNSSSSRRRSRSFKDVFKKRRTSPSPKRTPPSKMKRNNGKSLQNKLRSFVLDEEALRNRVKDLESHKEKLEKKIVHLNGRVEGHREREASLLETTAKSLQDLNRCQKFKTKLEKDIRLSNVKMKVLKKKLSKIETEKSDLEMQRSNSGLLSDMLTNFKELFENNLQCSICSEIFTFANVITCGHTFCEDCIEEWKTKKNNCPICRANIDGQVSNIVLDEHIEKMIEQFLPEPERKAREALVNERKLKRTNRVAVSKRTDEAESSSSDDDENFVLRRHLADFSSDDGNEYPFWERDRRGSNRGQTFRFMFDTSSGDDTYSPTTSNEDESDGSSDDVGSVSSSTESFDSSDDSDD